jgi:hypothetical protein
MILIDPPELKGDRLEIRFERFKEVDSLKEYADTVYKLDLNSGDNPVLFINTGITGLQQILDYRASHGGKAAVRDALNHSIAQAVWLELIISAAPEVNPDDLPDDWRGAVIRKAAKWLFPTKPLQETVPILVKGLTDTNTGTFERNALIGSLSAAVQRAVPLQKSARNLLTSYGL